MKKHFYSLKQGFSYYAQNLLGPKIKGKYVIIESDDWGSIRMSSKKAFQRLSNQILGLENSVYNKFDSLASEEDLSALFDVLSQFSGADGNPPVFTANTILTNPDFQKIKDSGFTEYHFEVFTDTLKRYSNHSKSFDLWQQGITAKVFKPQYHGREHLNFSRWLNLLKSGEVNVSKAFEEGVFGVPLVEKKRLQHNLMAAFDFHSPSEREVQLASVNEGASLFEKTFGYSSESFIAPNYIWDDVVENELSFHNVSIIQSGFYQFIPKGNGVFRKKMHYSLEKNQLNQIYSVRNCFFEPSLNQNFDWVANCLRRMEIAFRMNKPAIICSHRLNYIGAIDERNRSKNLNLLRELLKQIQLRWPDVRFISTDHLNKLNS